MNSSFSAGTVRLGTLCAAVLSIGISGISGCGLVDASDAAQQPGYLRTSDSLPAADTSLTPAYIPSFYIAPNQGVNLYDTTFAITTNGPDWVLAWRGDRNTHRFTGEIVNATRIERVVFAGAFAGDRVTQVAPNRLRFDGHTDGTHIQSLTLTSRSEPLRFNLSIDGYSAAYSVVFPAGGYEATSDMMPFDLSTSYAHAKVLSAPSLPADKARLGQTPPANNLTQSATENPFFIRAPQPRTEQLPASEK